MAEDAELQLNCRRGTNTPRVAGCFTFLVLFVV